MSSTYTRTQSIEPNQRDSTIPRFHIEPVLDERASAEAGRPIYVEQERIQYLQPGSPNAPVDYVNDSHKQRWPEEYARFKAGLDFSVSGTPLEQWPLLNRKHVLELKGMDIHTVEQCAALSDHAVAQIGMGGHRIRDNAKAYLDDAAATAITSKALADAERAEMRAAELEIQVRKQGELLNQLHEQLMNLRNAPSPIDAYVQGDHDPMQAHNRPQKFERPVASALDSIPARRGRPPKVKEEPQTFMVT